MSEEILCKAKRSFSVYLWVIIRFLLVIIFAVIVANIITGLYNSILGEGAKNREFEKIYYDPRFWLKVGVSSIFIFFGLILFLGRIIRLLISKLSITTTRINGSYGIIRKQVIDIPLSKVDSIEDKTNLVGRIFRFSTIKIKSSAISYTFKYVCNANQLKSKLYEAKDIEQKRLQEDEAKLLANIMANEI